MTRRKQILKAIEMLERKKRNVSKKARTERNYRTSVENLVIGIVSSEEKIQKDLDRLYAELEKEVI